MKTLYNIITYNHHLYPALTEEKDRQLIDQLVSKLQFLEQEILSFTTGSINLSPTGNLFVRDYPAALQAKISKL